MKKNIWERALLISFFLHLVLVPYFSWALGNQLISQPKKEKIIELQMVSVDPKPKEQISQQKKLLQPEKRLDQHKVLTSDSKKIIKKVMLSDSVPTAKSPEAITDQVKTATPTLGSQQSKERNNDDSGETKRPTTPSSRQYVSPQLLTKEDPVYPQEAREKNQEGIAVVRLQVLENGQVGEVSLKKSSGDTALDEAAIRAVKKWHFVPAKDKETGEPVKCFTSLPVVFHLQ